MWTDTHLHLDASEYDSDRERVVQHAREMQVTSLVLPAVGAFNFQAVRMLARQTPGAVYCLGIHPVFVDRAADGDLASLEREIEQSMNDPKFAGIGEIGLDGFVPGLNWNRQVEFFHAQLRMARDFDLPVVMHVRKAQDSVLKGLRIFKPKSGIAHAFNGSFQQAGHFLDLNMCLGFGGACTFTRALQIRRLAAELPVSALVLETDGPDIPPEWINHERNSPAHLPRIAQVIAELRGMSVESLSIQTQLNARRALPALNNPDKSTHA